VKKHGTVGIFKKKLVNGDIKEKVEEFLNGIYLSLSEGGVQKPRSRKRLIIGKKLTKKQVENAGSQKRSVVEVSITGKHKTPLPHL
jgi:hypothetical protein